MFAVLRPVAVLTIVLLAFSAAACADGRDGAIYERGADASAAIDTALAQADARGVNALLVFGANWCHDSRGLAHELTTHEVLAPYARTALETVFIDVGVRDRNLDQLARFGVDHVYGTPTVLVVNPEGSLLNAATVHDWRMVDDAAPADVGTYLAQFASAPAPIEAEASARITELAEGWAQLIEARADLQARLDAGTLSEEDATRLSEFYSGFARSMSRRALGLEAKAQEVSAANAEDLDELGLTASQDLTDAVAARMSESEIDLVARAFDQLELPNE